MTYPTKSFHYPKKLEPMVKPPKEHNEYWAKWPQFVERDGVRFIYRPDLKGVSIVPNDGSYERFISNSWYE